MNLRTRYMPGVYTVTDEDTGEILIFSFGEPLNTSGCSISHESVRRTGRPWLITLHLSLNELRRGIGAVCLDI